jgi:hypothetical protein
MNETADNWNPDDKLNRKESADFLTNYLVKRYELASHQGTADSFVLNIRADWGFGKSFFMQRWAKDLQQGGFPVVCYNAWENDFCDDPLIGFIAEINNGLSGHFTISSNAQCHLDKALAVGRKLIKPVSLGIASALTKKLTNYSIEELKEFYSRSAEETDEDDESAEGEGKPEKETPSSLISKYAEVALKEHLNTKETIKLFKKRLGRLIETLQKEEGAKLPLFIFIDELDRCRPTYAIELLETVKHLFGVPGVYFVIATNLEQLSHSIRAVYGEQFDSYRYLKRFFDQEYLLPEPDSTSFTKFLFSRYSISDFRKNRIPFYTVIEEGLYGDTPPEEALFSILCDSFRLSLRDKEQVAGALQTILLNWPKEETIHLPYLLFLIVTKHISPDLYQKLAENNLLDQTNFNQAILTKLRRDATFMTNDSDFGGYAVKAHGVLTLLWTYQALQSSTWRELVKQGYNQIKFPEKILYEVRRGFRSQPLHEPPLGWYFNLVSQAGQLTN